MSSTTPRTASLGWAALASLGAGAVHATAAGAHGDPRSAAIAFGLLAVAQLAWGALALVRSHPAVSWLGVSINATALAGWVLAKTTGIPGIDGLQAAEGPGFADTAAAALALVATGGALAALAAPGWRPRIPRVGLAAASAVATVVVLAAMVSAGDHAHTGDHDDGHPHGGVHDDGHDHDGTGSGAGDRGADGHPHGTGSDGHDHGDEDRDEHAHGDEDRDEHAHGDEDRDEQAHGDEDGDEHAHGRGGTNGDDGPDHDHDGDGTLDPGDDHDHEPGGSGDNHDHEPGGPGDDHDASGHHGDDHDDGSGGLPTKRYDGTLPVDLSGVPGVTPEQQASAEALVTDTIVALPRFADRAAAVAAGYRTVGDAFTGYEHLINWSLLDDGRILDAEHPESLVYRVGPAGERTLEAAMYMLEPGATLDTVPDVGGPLVQWHVHQNLCWSGPDDAGQVVSVVDPPLPCPAGTDRRAVVPMIHVWIVANPCGPFAALEGVSGGQVGEGEEVLCDHAHG